ncbi:MAG: response regulator [Terriglobales bacterium]
MPHVLLIDDSPLQLRVREAVLRDAGFQVSIATTAEGALAVLRTRAVSGTIGAVITDHVMPDISGVELVRAVREIQPDIPVIVITGRPDVEAEYEGLDVIFRVKPVRPSDLIALVRDCTGEAAA